MRYVEGNKNDSPGQICAPLRLLKYSLITVFYPKVIVECVPKWITFPLSRSHSLHLSLFCCSFLWLLLPFSFLLQVSFSPFNGLHMSAKWPWHCCDKVKYPSAPSMLFLPGLDHSVLLKVHNPNPLPTHLSKPHYQDPHSSVTLPELCNYRLTFWVSVTHLFRLEGRDIVHTTLTSK